MEKYTESYRHTFIKNCNYGINIFDPSKKSIKHDEKRSIF